MDKIKLTNKIETDHRYMEQNDSCQKEEGLGPWVKKMKGLSKQRNKPKNRDRQQQCGDY